MTYRCPRLVEGAEHMTYEEYVGEIHVIAIKFGWATESTPYADFGSWLDAFEEGLTPQEAFDEDVYAGQT